MKRLVILYFSVWALSLSCGTCAFVAPVTPGSASLASPSARFQASPPSDGADSGISEEERMQMVRELQKSFYQQTFSEDDSTSSRPQLQPDSGIITNLPLWRVGWVETPGRANCLNVHEGQYTHMFETILAGPQPWYVGHLRLPGGFKMTRTGEKRFQLKTWQEEMADEQRDQGPERSEIVGTLMRITDYRRTTDGRLILLVHAMERFVVENVVQHFPFSVADVQILLDTEDLPDGADENFSKPARAAAVSNSFQFHDYEYDHVKLPLTNDGDYVTQDNIIGSEIAKVLPFAFYSSDDSSLDNVDDKASSDSSTSSESFAGGQPALEQQLQSGGILKTPQFMPGSSGSAPKRKETNSGATEKLLWLAMEDFCRNTGFTLPEEVLCLMPPDMDYLDMKPPKQRLSPKYPALRRQRRLSYSAPALIEKLEAGSHVRQAWLDTPSTQGRLNAVLQRYEIINSSLMGEFQ